MTLDRVRKVGLTAGLAVLATLAAGGMAMGPPDHPVRMSDLRVEGLASSPVVDPTGAAVGKIIDVQTDRDGRARWLDIALDAGGEARVASFRAFLDAPHHRIALTLPEDLLIARADATRDLSTSPSI